MSTVGGERGRVYCPLGQVRSGRRDVSFETEEQKRLRPTSLFLRRAFLGVLASCFIRFLSAQELSPRAYIITPVHSNAINLTWSFYDGGVDFNGVYPYSGTTGVYHVPVLSYYHAFSFFGRSANVTASLPYGVGHFEGNANGTDQSIYRSGLLDFSARLSVNLYGGKAMRLPEFLSWKQKKLLGASLKVVAPAGQYNGNALINWGINRWALKPELGYSQRWGHWILDSYAGAWFYTVNPEFGYGLPAPKAQTEAPVGSLEGHFSYDFPKVGLWASFDSDFWWGGEHAFTNRSVPSSRQLSSRLGGTVSVPFTRHQSIKIAYSDGVYVRVGGNYQNLQVAWQYSWIGKRW